MNTIKYRALAKDGTWRYGEYPHFVPEMSNTHYPMDVFWNSFLSTFRRETLRLWTGLLDKQGKEIYEGDILENGSTYRNDPKLITVVWNERDGAFNGKVGVSRLSLSCAYWFYGNCEVISNIYENPELLEGDW